MPDHHTADTYEDEAASLSALADRLEELFGDLDKAADFEVRSAGNDVDNARRSLRQAVDKLDHYAESAR